MKRLCITMTVVLVVSLGSVEPATACSTFLFRSDHGLIFGRNTDTNPYIPGFWTVNKRGIQKTAIPWGVFAPSGKDIATPQWVSRYGSVTVSAFGREFPDGGMNEAGLVVEEMTLAESVYPPEAGGRSLSQQQWIQYQLDNYATVQEVLENLSTVSPKGWPWHYLVADAAGHCATIEFLNGAAVVAANEAGSNCALTNNTLQQSQENLKNFEGFGGAQQIPEDRSSLSRFARVSAGLNSLAQGTDESTLVASGFELLDAVAQGEDTIRSIVHDLAARKIYFRSANQRSIKVIDLHRLDFSSPSPVLTIDMESPLAGDVSDKLVPFSDDVNRRVFDTMAGLFSTHEEGRKMVEAELNAAGLTYAAYADLVSRYHHSTRAVE